MELSNIKKRLETWEKESSRKEKILLCILTILIPSLIFFQFYYQPTQEKIKILKEEIKKIEIDITKLEYTVKKEKEIERFLNEREKFLEEIKLILPTEEEIPGLLKEVSKTAKKYKLEILLFSPKLEISQDYYNILPLDIHLKGGFKEFLGFLNAIEKLPRLISLEKLEIHPLDKDGMVLVKCNFITYKYTGIPLEKKEKK